MIIYDPEGWGVYTKAQISQQIGILPGLYNKHSEVSLLEQMSKNYGLPLIELKESTIGERSSLQYPEDPDLKLLAAIFHLNECALIYQYGLVAFQKLNDEGQPISTFVTRMD